jgi:hypothetical protein
MKSTDLRIGNLILKNNEIYEISSLFFVDLHDGTIRENNNYVIKPIPITEEWLLKFGFKKHLTEDTYPTFAKNMLNWNDGILYLIGYGFINHINYLHQLQNLYFALTGVELIIKDLK